VSQRQNISGTWTTSYYGYDGFGSTRQLLDGAGVVTDTFAYDGFGNLVARTGTTPNQYLYRGEALDAGTGMYYLRARWYRPGVGRFLTIDKYERDLLSSGPQRLAKQVSKSGALKLVQQFFEAYRFDSMCSSLYCYSYGDPIGFIDPSGLSAERAVTAQLSASSLGLGQNVIVRGSIQVIGSEATAFVELIEGTLGNPFSVLPNLMKLAISLGAAEIYVVTQFANPRLLEVATKRYGFVSYGGYEILRLIF
jgi:RHS repeat-associated protein